MSNMYTVWHNYRDEQMCVTSDFGVVANIVKTLSKKHPEDRFDLTVSNQNGELNVGIFRAGEFIGMDSEYDFLSERQKKQLFDKYIG